MSFITVTSEAVGGAVFLTTVFPYGLYVSQYCPDDCTPGGIADHIQSGDQLMLPYQYSESSSDSSSSGSTSIPSVASSLQRNLAWSPTRACA